MKPLTTEQFIEKAITVHNNEYDYSKVIYVNSFTKVEILCKNGHSFFQLPHNHLAGRGCNKCNVPNKSNQEEFIKKAINLHGLLFDYSLVEYVTNKTKIEIICNKCKNVFLQRPDNHLGRKSGCPFCAGNHQKTIEDFIKEAKSIHQDLFDYSLVNYINSNIKIKIICNECDNIFEQTPQGHLTGQGCSNCYGNKRFTTEEFIKKSIKYNFNSFDYSLVNYINGRTKVKIICNSCLKTFERTPILHLKNHGCPFCSFSSISKKETEWLDSFNILKENRQFCIKINEKRFKVDGYDPETNTVYEFLGDFWHGNPEIFDQNVLNPKIQRLYGEIYKETFDRIKVLEDNGYKVIYIWENDYKKQLKVVQ